MFEPFPHEHVINHTPAIWLPDTTRNDYVVAHFRVSFSTAAIKKLTLLVTASQRFVAYLDGSVIGRGPTRSDSQRWHVHRLELPTLKKGRHVLGFTVWHYGKLAPFAQMGPGAFLLVRPETTNKKLLAALTTGPQYRCWHDQSITPIAQPYWGDTGRYFVVGPSERVEAAKYPWEWQSGKFDDSGWAAATVVQAEAQDVWGNQKLHCELRPNPLPAMAEKREAFARVVCNPVTWPVIAKAKTSIVLDRGTITNAYPQIRVRGGNGAKITCVWSEAPYNDDGSKPQRHDAEGKQLFGQQDVFVCDGGDRTFTTLWFRSFRYLHITIEPKGQAVTVDEPVIYGTGLPLKRPARLEVDAAHAEGISTIMSAIHRTIELCAHETYFDCPHYEQCQFPGDSDVQTLYHYVVLGSDTLPRKAIDDFFASRVPSGIVQCRWPTNSHVQIIPTFGLLTLAVLHDLLKYRGHVDFVRDRMAAAREVLDYYVRLLRPDGMLGHVPYAPFIDWAKGFSCGNPAQDADGGSSILTLQFARTLRQMAYLEENAGMPELAPRWRSMAARSIKAVMNTCWSRKRGMLADTPKGGSFSVHAQVMAVLADAVGPAVGSKILNNALGQPGVIQPGTLYFRHYLTEAFKAVGQPERFYDLLGDWARILNKFGMNTLPESDYTPRSDCHAWGASPAYQLLQIGLGIHPDPAAIGFARAVFKPVLGPLTHMAGSVQTPHGPIHVRVERHAKTMRAEVQSPVPIIVGKRVLKPGSHRLDL